MNSISPHFSGMCSLLILVAGLSGCDEVRRLAGMEGEVPSIQKRTLQPSEIHTDLRGLEAQELLTPPDGADEPMQYIALGEATFETYDKFFRQTAQIVGLVWVAQHFLRHAEQVVADGFLRELQRGRLFERALDEASELPSLETRRRIAVLTLQGRFDEIPSEVEGINQREIASLQRTALESYPELELVIEAGPAIVEEFNPSSLRDRLEKLEELGRNLSEQVARDFAGPQATLIPQLTEEMSRMMAKLGEAAEQMPQTARDLESLTREARASFENAPSP